MKRITPEQVVEAYKVTGLKPCRVWTTPTGGECCGMGAIAVAAGTADHPLLWADGIYGHQYRLGFTFGFDDYGQNWRQEEPRNADFDSGYADGLAAAAAVFGGQWDE